MNCLADDHVLHISSVHTEEEGILCQHVYLADGVRTRALYSASVRLETTDRRRHRIACANRALHWHDMLQYQSLGRLALHLTRRGNQDL